MDNEDYQNGKQDGKVARRDGKPLAGRHPYYYFGDEAENEAQYLKGWNAEWKAGVTVTVTPPKGAK